MTSLRAIRGAVQVREDTPQGIDAATRELLLAVVERNELDPSTLIAIWITQTADLRSAHAPAAARGLGWRHVPLLGAQEAPVDDDLPRVVRALVLAPAVPGSNEVRHVYLGETRLLRPDLSASDEVLP
jgi:chorismate mutase